MFSLSWISIWCCIRRWCWIGIVPIHPLPSRCIPQWSSSWAPQIPTGWDTVNRSVFYLHSRILRCSRWYRREPPYEKPSFFPLMGPSRKCNGRNRSRTLRSSLLSRHRISRWSPCGCSDLKTKFNRCESGFRALFVLISHIYQSILYAVLNGLTVDMFPHTSKSHFSSFFVESGPIFDKEKRVLTFLNRSKPLIFRIL